jgi:hypothetical protein
MAATAVAIRYIPTPAANPIDAVAYMNALNRLLAAKKARKE